METILNIPNISHVIQQAVAPVFLLTGIGSILSVLTSRLGRIVDRFRLLSENRRAEFSKYKEEILTLSRRAKWIHWAIIQCTLSALCICLSIATLFIGLEVKFDFSQIVSLLFVAAMLTLITGLLCFFREIALSTGSIEMVDLKFKT